MRVPATEMLATRFIMPHLSAFHARHPAGHDPALVRVPTATSPAPRVIWQAVHADLQRSARSTRSSRDT